MIKLALPLFVALYLCKNARLYHKLIKLKVLNQLSSQIVGIFSLITLQIWLTFLSDLKTDPSEVSNFFAYTEN